MSSPFTTALFHPLNLFVLLVAVAAGLLAAWWLFPLGLLVWLAMVLILARDPRFRMAHLSESRAPLAQRYQTLYDKVKRAQLSLYHAADTTDARVKADIQPVLTAVNEMVDEAYRLCQRMTALENLSLVTDRNNDTRAEMDSLALKIQQANDPRVKQEYEEALTALKHNQQRLDDLKRQLERADAELTSLPSDISSIAADVLQTQLRRENTAERIAAATAKINERIQALRAFAQ